MQYLSVYTNIYIYMYIYMCVCIYITVCVLNMDAIYMHILNYLGYFNVKKYLNFRVTVNDFLYKLEEDRT